MCLSTEVMYDLQRSQGSELLKGAWLYPPDLVMLQASVETHTHTHTQYIKCTNGSVESDMPWGWGLNYSHLLQRRAAVKAGQMLYLVVGQLTATIHKAHKQWPAVIAAWEMTASARVSGCRFSSVSMAGQSFCGWLDFTVQWLNKCFGAQSASALFFFFYLSASPRRARILTALSGEAAAHTDPEGALRVRLESAFCREREDSLVIVKMRASERSPWSSDPNSVRHGPKLS